MAVRPNSLNGMSQDVYDAYRRDFERGVVTLGNVCDANCFFCSQKVNPPGVVRDLRRFLTFAEVRHFVDRYLSGVTFEIGSAFHVNTGEVFRHPQIVDILEYLAREGKLGEQAVCFTNGMNLSEEHVRVVSNLDMSMILSLNSADAQVRRKVMGGGRRENENAIRCLGLMDGCGLRYTVSIVPLVSTISSGDVDATCRFVSGHRAESVYIIRPGYTKHTDPDVAAELKVSDETVLNLCSEMSGRYGVRVYSDLRSASDQFKEVTYRTYVLLRNRTELKDKVVLCLCSGAAEELLPLSFAAQGVSGWYVQRAESHVFGGSIDCAGLLLVEDYVKAADRFLHTHPTVRPEALILPKESFCPRGDDMAMVSSAVLADRFDTEVVLA